MYLVQIPRLYAVYKEQGIIENFEQMLDNIFVPLFEVTKDPASHPQLHLFLKQACGRACVDTAVRGLSIRLIRDGVP
jgi:AMP deaminase